jgi:hypothetical protein
MRSFFPNNIAKKFSKGLLPVLRALTAYLEAEIQVLHGNLPLEKLLKKNEQLKGSLGTRNSAYPKWVFARGFNPRLRAGMRFFLLQVEALVELIFAMDYLLSCELDEHHQCIILPPLTTAIEENIFLLHILDSYLSTQRIITPHELNNDAITTLQIALQQIIPAHLQLLDLSPDYLVLSAWVQHMKDMREILLSLLASLPSDAGM